MTRLEAEDSSHAAVALPSATLLRGYVWVPEPEALYMHPVFLCALASPLLLAPAQGRDGAAPQSPSSRPPSASALSPDTSSLGVAAGRVIGEGSLWYIGVREAAQPQDLNGDGDLEDEVVHVYDARRNSLLNIGQAFSARPEGTFVQQPLVAGRWMAFLVDEFDQGGIDVNGDGDALDAILWTYDADREEARSLGLTVININGFYQLTETRLVAAALDDEFGLTVFDHDRRTRTTRRIGGLATGTPAAIHGDEVAVVLAEFPRSEGAEADLNGDGDSLDHILRIFDFRTETLLNTGLASGGLPIPLGRDWLVAVNEFQHGGQDLDGDGDVDGFVYHLYDPASGVSENLRLPFSNFRAETDDRVFLGMSELVEEEDLNGDGDGTDTVLLVVDAATRSVANFGVAVREMVLLDRWLIALVPESEQGGIDLSGDGDSDDDVLHAIDLRTLRVHDLGVDASFSEVVAVGNTLFFLREESASATDWNGDGDLDDRVLFRWSGYTRELRNSGIGAVGLETDGRRLLISQAELLEGVDLNGDGDLEDLVSAVVGVRTLRAESVGIAGLADLAGPGRVLVRARESWEGRDLNGDGDLLDVVPVLVRGTNVP